MRENSITLETMKAEKNLKHNFNVALCSLRNPDCV